MLCFSGKRYCNSIVVRKWCPSLWVEGFRNLDYCTGNKRDCFHSYLHFIMKLLLGNTGNEGVCLPRNPRILYIYCTSKTKPKKMRCFCLQISSFVRIHQESMTESKTRRMQMVGQFFLKIKLFFSSSALFLSNSVSWERFSPELRPVGSRRHLHLQWQENTLFLSQNIKYAEKSKTL